MKVHILHGGLALCKFVDTKPVYWPTGHAWAPEYSWENLEGQPAWTSSHSKCVDCDSIYNGRQRR